MKKRNGIYLVVIVWLFGVCCTGLGTAAAAKEDELESHYSGKILFIPSVEAIYQNDSNYYSERTQEVSANIYTLKPGFEFGYATPKSEVFLDYYLTVNEYSGDQRLESRDYYGHDFKFGAQTQVTEHILVGIQDDYLKFRASGSLDDLGNEVNRGIYKTNSLSPFLKYEFDETWGMDFRYTNLILDYDEKSNEDSEGHRGAFDLNYHLNSTTRLILEYNVWNRDYDRNTPTYLSQQTMMSYEKEYQYFFLKAGLGYHSRNFEDTGDRDIEDFVWDLSLYGEAAKTRYYLALDRNFNDFGEGQQYYKGVSITAMAGYLFAEKLDLELMLDYRHRNYQYDPKKEDIWYYSTRLSYLLTERLSVGLKLAYEERDSNRWDRDYDNRIIGINVKYSYDISGK